MNQRALSIRTIKSSRENLFTLSCRKIYGLILVFCKGTSISQLIRLHEDMQDN